MPFSTATSKISKSCWWQRPGFYPCRAFKSRKICASVGENCHFEKALYTVTWLVFSSVHFTSKNPGNFSVDHKLKLWKQHQSHSVLVINGLVLLWLLIKSSLIKSLWRAHILVLYPTEARVLLVPNLMIQECRSCFTWTRIFPCERNKWAWAWPAWTESTLMLGTRQVTSEPLWWREKGRGCVS